MLNLLVVSLIFVLSISLAAVTTTAQASKTFSGSWQWTSRPDSKGMQDYFYLDIRQKGNKVTGNLGFSTLLNGEVEDEAGKTPFIGTIKGDTLIIEFDAGVIDPLDEKNVRYRRPKNKTPDKATLRLKAGTLNWSQTKKSYDHLPASFSLRRP
jgi:hypothetical protein